MTARFISYLFTVYCLLSLVLFLKKDTAVASEASRKPNIIFILADDLGWSELGCYGNGFNETPNLDQLAKEGMRFTNAYAAAPVCSPYRAALLTGQYPARVGILDYLRPNSSNGLSTRHITLPEMLKRNGYATGMAGKWHLTGYKYHKAIYEVKPKDHGFDWDFGREIKGVGNGANFWPYVFRTQPISWIDIKENRLGKKEFLVDRMNIEAVDFIERSKDKPFFLYLSHYAPHTIMNGKPELVEKYVRKHPPGKSTRTKCYLCEDQGHEGDLFHHWAQDHNPHLAAMLESIDDGVGMIQKKLKESGIADNTILVFSSDNGGELNVTSNAPLRGGKSQLYEGGIRVPMIVRWPGQVPANTVCDEPTMNIDFYPTFLAAAGIEPDKAQTLDGTSILATWKNPKQKNEHSTLCWHYPLDKPHFLGGVSGGAIRDGDWKLIEHFDTGERELFSLADDPSEKTNVAGKHPDKVKILVKKLEDWRLSVEAKHPSPPLLVKPRSLAFADHFEPEQISERWWFGKDWFVEDGLMHRSEGGKGDTRVFLKETTFSDLLIRFDFQLKGSKDIRMVTSGGGSYNSVIHIRPDHFFIQTAADKSVPHFSYRHSECAFTFDPDRWYTMTVEYLGDQLVAHIDREHLVYATHPMINREREYFAFQVDASPAAFDNVQMFTVHKANEKGLEARLAHIQTSVNKYPHKKTAEETLKIEKTNALERLYQSDEKYRALVAAVTALDNENQKRFPEALSSHKEMKKAIQAERKRLHEEDPVYKETLFATYRAEREIEAFLISKKPEVSDLPNSGKQGEIERLRRQYEKDEGYIELVRKRQEAQEKLEKAYPRLFVSDEELTEKRRAKRKELEASEEFRTAIQKRAEAYRAQQDYLFENDEKLKAAQEVVNSEQ